MRLLVQELAAMCEAIGRGQLSPLKPLTVQYTDHAAWQRDWLQGDVREKQIGYWREQLADLPPLDLATDYPRPDVQTYRGSRCTYRLGPELWEQIKSFSQGERVTPFMTLLTAFQVLLGRYSGQDNFAVGVTHCGAKQAGVQPLIGIFLNTLALRANLGGQASFRELVRRTGQTAMAAYANQDVPFEMLLQELQPKRDLSRTPLFQVFFNLLHMGNPRIELPDLVLEVLASEEAAAKFDMTLYQVESEGGLDLRLVFNRDLFQGERMAELLTQYEQLLSHSISHPDERPLNATLVTPQSRAVLPNPSAALTQEFPGTITEHFARHVRHAGDRTALTSVGTRWTYDELDRRSNQLANYLCLQGIQGQDVVAVYACRDASLACALLGILKAGAAFVILDQAYPVARLCEYLRIAKPRAWIQLASADVVPPEISRELHEQAIGCRVTLSASPAKDAADPLHGWSEEVPDIAVGADDLAYLAFTSGTTGSPNAVQGTHRPLSHFLQWYCHRFSLKESDRFSMLSGLSHDPLLRDVFTPLWLGAVLCVPDPAQYACDGAFEWLRQSEVSVVHLTPAFAQLLGDAYSVQADDSPGLSTLRYAFFGGDVLTCSLVERFRLLAPSAGVVNLYGATETPQAVGYHEVAPQATIGGSQRIPLGQGVEGTQLLLLNAEDTLCGIGEKGEICVRSSYLSRGYLDAQQLNREKFIANPFGQDSRDRIYRTGDSGRYLTDGNVEFLGRMDQQVKIRGFRIELGEIEAMLSGHEDVRQAVARACEDRNGQEFLAAYVVANSEPQPSAESLRQFLRTRLPDAMVPSSFVFLDRLPLTANNKVDRGALPAPEMTRPTLETPFVPPGTQLERDLAKIWQEVLEVDRVGVHDDFFALGGHSLLATQVASRVHRLLQLQLPLRDLFTTTTVAQLAERIEVIRREEQKSTRPPLLRAARDSHLPLSLNQEALWFLDRLEPNRPTYTNYPAFRIRGPLDLQALQASLNEMQRRHEILRTIFPEHDGRPIQVILPAKAGPLPLTDLSDLPAERRQAELHRSMKDEMQRPIDLAHGPVIRIQVIRLAEEEHVVIAATHHIIHDGWSLTVMVRELSVLYPEFCAGRLPTLPELPIQYADFATWQRNLLQGATLEGLQDYWSEQLRGVPPLDLPTDFPRPPLRTTRGDGRPCQLSSDLSDAVKSFSKAEGVTPFMTLLAAFQVLLQRFSGQDDFAVGTPTANRTMRETEPLIGYFINMLVLRANLAEASSFREVVQRVRSVALDAFEHQDLTLDQVVDAVNPVRDMSRHPLFQVMFVLQNTPKAKSGGLGVEIGPVRDRPAARSSDFEVSLTLRETDKGYAGRFRFQTDLFAGETIERMVAHYQLVLAEALAAPDRPLSQLPLVSEPEREQLVIQWATRTSESLRDVCIHERFEQQVQRTPQAVAIVDGSRQWTYQELNGQANRLAHYLRERGVAPDKIVAVRLQRSPELVAVLLAVLKAGGAYLPLDPALPPDRLEFTLADAKIDVIVTDQSLLGDLPEDLKHVICLDRDRVQIDTRSEGNPSVSTQSGNLAYVIYTSGSTGRPKGVMIEHRALVNYTDAAIDEYEITAEDRVLQFVSFSYDAHVEEVYPTLICGATLVLRSDDMIDSCEKFFRLCDQWGITLVTYPTGFWHECVTALKSEQLPLPKSLRLVIIGGEQALRDRLATWWECVGDRVKLLNTYGPTETTVVATSTQLTCEDSQTEHLPIGRPVAGFRAYVLDSQLRPVPIGVRGELFIGGQSVARGYLNREELTQQRFVSDPFADVPDARMYKTGDLVRWGSDGRLQFIGRTDHQVKIRGFRVEPGEVEQVLRQHPPFTDAVVVSRERSPGQPRLVAYVTGGSNEELTVSEMRQFLSGRLPEYMIPSMLIAIDEMPSTNSGKVDRQALPEPDWSGAAQQGEYVAPRTATEEQMAKIWSEVLEVERVGVNDSFFDLGGNSLLALRLTAGIRDRFHTVVSLAELFQHTTLASLAELTETLRLSGHRSAGAPIPILDRRDRIRLSIQQEWMWQGELRNPGNTLRYTTALPLTGDIAISVMQDTLDELIRRHEVLRTIFFEEDGQVYQRVESASPAKIDYQDLRHLDESEQERIYECEAERHRRFVINPRDGSLYLFNVLRCDDRQSILMLTLSHFVFDAWSMEILRREIVALYPAFRDGRPSPLGTPRLQYADYAAWQRARLDGDELDDARAYWNKKIVGLQPLPSLLDQPAEHAGATPVKGHSFPLDPSLVARMQDFCRRRNLTPYVMQLTAFNILLHQRTGSDDIAIETLHTGRSRSELHNVVGPFFSSLLMRTNLAGDPSLAEMLDRVKTTVLEAFEHQDVPYDEIQRIAGTRNEDGKTIPWRAFANFVQFSAIDTGEVIGNPTLERRSIEKADQFMDAQLEFNLYERVSGLRGNLNFDPDGFQLETILEFQRHLLDLFERVIDRPNTRISELSSVSPGLGMLRGGLLGEY